MNMPLTQESRQITHSARRINALAEIVRARTYLEVGVADGGTFFGVSVRDKTAVDPDLRFPHEERADAHTRFHEVTSDHFFTALADPGTTFDIMFLDGLHHFEQTFRDFCASQRHAHENTIWLIDDVIPRDVYSALRDPRQTRRFRNLAGIQGGGWHGDIYKVVFAIRDFFPTFDFCTIHGSGNPQTIVIRRSRADFAPLYNDLERISRMDYFEFASRRPLLNLMSETDALAWVADRLALPAPG
jgi:hypothetical protein